MLQKFEIRLTNKDFIPKLNFEQAFSSGMGNNPKSQTFKFRNFFPFNKKEISIVTKLPRLFTNMHRQKARDNHRYTYGTTMNERDSVMIALWFRP